VLRGQTTLAAYLRPHLPEGCDNGLVQGYLAALERYPVELQDMDGVTVSHIDGMHPLDHAEIFLAGGDQLLMEACAAAISAQPTVAWPVAMVFNGLLQMSYDMREAPPEPTVLGIS
jgi:hypothetical protein